MKILQPLILMMDIPLDMRQIDSPEGSGYYSKSAPTTVLNSIRIINSRLLFLQYPNPEKQGDKLLQQEQLKFLLFTAIMTNHCSSRWKQYSPPVKADFLRNLQQHPMLLSAYLKEPTPQSSAGFKLLPSQQKLAKRLFFRLLATAKKYPPSPAKVFIAEIPQRSSQVLGIVS